MKCKICNGNCEQIEGGKFRCVYCGQVYSESDLVSSKSSKEASGGADVFEKNINGILEIRWADGRYVHSGSGFLINELGYAITNTHVVTFEDGTSCKNVDVKLCGKNVSAEVVALGDDRHGSGAGVDLALVKIKNLPREAKTMKFEDFKKVRIGEKVYVVGNSLGYGTCITSGVVSDKSRNVNGKMLLMTDCAVNGGNSGGPIFNENGKVIGAIVSGIDSAEGMNFAIPVDQIIDFLKKNRIIF